MKFSINKSELQSVLSVVQKGTSTRSTLPVLSGILIEAETDNLTFMSSDLELSIKSTVPALIEEPGRTVVPGKLFSDIVKSLPDAAVHVTYEDGESEATISCDSSTFSVRTLAAADFPGFPTVEPSETIKIDFEVFSTMVRRVSRVVSKDESRAILTGVLIEADDGALRMVATDSYRLALTETPFESGVEVTRSATAESEDAAETDSSSNASSGFNVVIDGRFLNDVAGLNVAEQELTIGVSANQILITCDNMTFINRRIEGNYPNYRQLTPDSYETRATFPVESLNSAVKRASLMSSSNAPLRFRLSPDVNLATITVNSQDIGSVQENIDCPIEGAEVEIAFNSTYVADGLSTVKDEEVYFDVQSPLKPGIFRSIDSNEYLYLIMPVRV